MSAARRIFETLFKRDPQAVEDLPEAARRNLPGNALRLVGATALQSTGDQVVNASTVLPWLFTTLGVPSALVGLLVPIRESGSMLPQAVLTPLVLRVRRRKWAFVTGALVQAATVAAMALIAAIGHGLVAGVLILIALAVFALGRSLTSIASKDVLGRTMPRGSRGQINGLSTTASGIVAITLGLVLRLVGGRDLSPAVLAWLLAGGAIMWLFAALVYSRVREPAGESADQTAPEDGERSAETTPDREDEHSAETTPDREGERSAETTPDGEDEHSVPAAPGWFSMTVALLRDDVPFRRFVIVRSLLLVSALSPPFVVTLAVSSGSGALGGLGGFIIASGLAALIGGPVFGRIADRASRTLMAVGAGVASLVLVLLLVVTRLPGFDGGTVWGAAVFVATYFVLTLVHTGVRVGRKTYVVDMAEGDQRTKYVAVSNSAMGVILLAAGGVSSVLSLWGVEWALAFLAGLGLIGVLVAVRLPEVSAR
ncbi:MFS transporter [Homoserinimonas sp. OAct 916]|uniref:MFS transporter n=1 Tax=Homoserinimonas sp. OAct 916 TaxID=2211450 RepID=UPI000DBE5A81|nr:MFS transporter [Homoserinimonas sp. OAct 916]